MLYICIILYVMYLHTYIYIHLGILRFLEVALEIWSDLDLNPR